MRHFVDATVVLQKPLKFSDSISKVLAIYALSAQRITKLLRKKTYSKFLSGKFFVNNTAVSKANSVGFTKKDTSIFELP